MLIHIKIPEIVQRDYGLLLYAYNTTELDWLVRILVPSPIQSRDPLWMVNKEKFDPSDSRATTCAQPSLNVHHSRLSDQVLV